MERDGLAGRSPSVEVFKITGESDVIATQAFMDIKKLYGDEPLPAIYTMVYCSLVKHYEDLNFDQKLSFARQFLPVVEPFLKLIALEDKYASMSLEADEA